MREEQLKDLINFNNEYQREITLPNFLFDKLNDLVKQKKLKSQHIGFTYSYIYLITYLCRYTKYDYFIPSTSKIKEILGYSPTNKTLDYIIKENGLLDKDGITKTINDFPVVAMWEFNENYEKVLNITFISELEDVKKFKSDRFLDVNNFNLDKSKLNEYSKVGKKTKCKVPSFAFYQNHQDWESEKEYDGTFFKDYYDTGMDYTYIDFNVFAYCMANPDELGCNAFYLYCYLKHKNDVHGSYNATSERLSEETSLSKITVEKYRNNMRAYNMINLIHEMDYFVIGIDKSERRASANKVNPYEWFGDEKTSYKKLGKISLKQYEKQKELKEEFKELIEELPEQLPF